MLQIFFSRAIGFSLREEVEKNDTELLNQHSLCTAICNEISPPLWLCLCSSS